MLSLRPAHVAVLNTALNREASEDVPSIPEIPGRVAISSPEEYDRRANEAVDKYIAFLDNRRVPGEAKRAFLTQVTGELPVLTGNLVKLLESKRRLSLLPQIAESFQSMLDEHNNIAHAEVLTAVSLDEDQRNALTSRLSELTGKQVQVEIHEAPEILGGLVARIGDRLIDGSAKTKLLALKRQLARATR